MGLLALLACLAVVLLVERVPRAVAGTVGVEVTSSQLWVDPRGWLHATGEIENHSSTWTKTYLSVRFLDADGFLVASYAGFPTYSLLPPGASSSFDVIMPSPSAFERHEIIVEPMTVTEVPAQALSVFTDTIVVIGDELHVTGRIVNHGPWQISSPTATVVVRDALGRPVQVGLGGVPPGEPGYWPAGADIPFEVAVVELRDEYASITVQAGALISDPVMGGSAESWDLYLEDIGSTPFRADILWLANEGITMGCRIRAYCPASVVTREQMASLLVRALELPPSPIDAFTDDEGSPHRHDINALAAAGITNGCGPAAFCPSRLVTRAQMASFLSRAYGLPASPIDAFTDDDSSPHEPDIDRIAQAGITGGCGPARFCPDVSVTREQMAALLHRASP